jgi:hypothetical protein
VTKKTKKRTRITTASRAADLMRKDAILAKMHTRTGLCWFLVPGGEVSEAIAADLLKRPEVQPNDDGLFPGIPQTFKWVREVQRHDRASTVACLSVGK